MTKIILKKTKNISVCLKLIVLSFIVCITQGLPFSSHVARTGL
jgi:hypothetical protein